MALSLTCGAAASLGTELDEAVVLDLAVEVLAAQLFCVFRSNHDAVYG